jgi:hypothetical membrane protein
VIDRVRVGAAMWIVAAAAYFIAEAVAVLALPGYSYVTDYISVLGVPGSSPYADAMNAAFLLQGVFFPAGAVLVVRGMQVPKAWPFLMFAVFNGLGNALVAIVHAGTGSGWHPAGAYLAIGGGNLAILAGVSVLWRVGTTRTYLVMSLAVAGTGLFCSGMLKVHELPTGLWERGSVYSIYVWQTLTAVCLLRWRRAPACR